MMPPEIPARIPFTRVNGLTGRWECAIHGTQEPTGALMISDGQRYAAKVSLGCGCDSWYLMTVSGRDLRC